MHKSRFTLSPSTVSPEAQRGAASSSAQWCAWVRCSACCGMEQLIPEAWIAGQGSKVLSSG